MSDFGKRLIAGLEEVLADVRGEITLNRRTVIVEDFDVGQIRKKNNMTQEQFSREFGFQLRTLQQWEQKRRRPSGASRVLLKVINYAPDVVQKALHH